MSLDDDLATLRSHTPEYDGHDAEFTAALDRVEAELSRLREQRDAARAELDDVRDEYMADAGLRTAAEARCAQLRDEREDARAMTRIANSRAARLRDGLRHYRLAHGTRCTCSACDTARALLSEGGAA